MPLVNCSDGPPLALVTQAQALASLHRAVVSMVEVLGLAAGCLPADPVLRRLHQAAVTTLATFATVLRPSLEDDHG